MTFSHPFERIEPGRIRYYLLPLAGLVAALIAMLLFILPGRESNTLMDLVEAGSPEAAAAILTDWTAVERVRVAYLVGLDFLLNPAYANLAALACVWASRVIPKRAWTQLGIVLCWLAWFAIATNVVENIALYNLLLGNVASPWPELARLAHYFAGAVIFGGAVPYVLVACCRRVLNNTRAR